MTVIPVTPAAGTMARVPRTLWVLAAPRQTFAELAEGEGKAPRGYGLMFLWLLIELVLGAPGLAASIGSELSHEPLHGLTHLYTAYVRHVALPGVAMFLVGLAIYYVLRAKKARRDLWACVSIVSYAWVPHLVLVAIGAVLTVFNIDHLLPAPHLRTVIADGSARQMIAAAIEIGPVALFVYLATRALMRGQPPMPISSRERSRTWVVTLLFAALMVTSAAAATRTVRERWNTFRPVEIGESVPTLAVLDADGKPTQSPTFVGKVSIIDFWATWCGPCVTSLPMLERVARSFEDRGVQLVSLNTEPENLAGVRAFRAEHELAAKVYVDTGSAGERLHVTVLPTTLIVDKRGVLRYRHVGVVAESVLGQELTDLVNEP
ncbi:MAG: redoxin family protein [Myxococcota bacterium]